MSNESIWVKLFWFALAIIAAFVIYWLIFDWIGVDKKLENFKEIPEEKGGIIPSWPNNGGKG